MQGDKIYICWSLLFACFLMAIIGCATTETLQFGERKIIETSGKKPNWVVHILKPDKGKIYFTGSRTRGVTFEDSRTDARMMAIAQVSDQAKTEFKHRYERARTEEGLPADDEDIGFVLNDGIIAVSEVVVSGVREEDAYYEKYKEKTATGISYFYDLYMLVSMPDENFERAQIETVNKLQKKAREKKNEKAERLLERMRREIKAE